MASVTSAQRKAATSDRRTTMFGADYAKGPLVTGLSLSNSRGLGEYAGVTAAQDAAEHAAWACKNNYDSTTDAIRDARQELKELIESLRPWREGAAVGGLRLCGTRCDYRLVLSCCDGGDRRVAAGRCSRVVELVKGQGHLRVATNEEFNVRIPAAAPVPVIVTLCVPVMVEPLTVPLIASDTVMRSTSPPPEGHSIPVKPPTSAATAVKTTDELPAVPAYRVLVPVEPLVTRASRDEPCCVTCTVPVSVVPI